MGISTKASVASKFETGDKPTQQDFADWIDSSVFIPAGITGVIEVESTASATNRAIGAFGVIMLEAETTASALGHLNLEVLTSAGAQGAVGLQILAAGTTASAQGHIGAGSVGIQLIEAAATASAQNALGAGAVGVQLLEAATTASATNALGGAPILTLSYASSAQTISQAGLVTLTHGLGEEPKVTMTIIQCVSADAGYTAGQRVVYPISGQYDGANRGAAMALTATQIQIRYANTANVFSLAHATTGNLTALTNSNWQLYVKAYA